MSLYPRPPLCVLWKYPSPCPTRRLLKLVPILQKLIDIINQIVQWDTRI